MPDILGESPYSLLVVGIVLAGLWLSNAVYDRRVPHYVSRKVGHGIGGLAFLVGITVFSSAWWPIILAALFGVVLLAAHLWRPQLSRGVGGNGRDGSIFAEVWFAWVAVPVVGIAWLWLDRPEVALASLLYMAWGDGITGLVRAGVYRRAVKGLWGSAAMLVTCLLISGALLRPFWIGALASLAAVAVEWAFGDTGVFRWADDNWAVPLASMGVILLAMKLSGNI